jgi:hypothetical protein
MARMASRNSIRHGLRRLAARAGLHAASLRARTRSGALAEAGRLTDRTAIKWVRERDGGFFLVRAGHELVACDVLPGQRVVLVLAIVGRHELLARLGLSSVSPRAVPVGSFGWRP